MACGDKGGVTVEAQGCVYKLQCELTSPRGTMLELLRTVVMALYLVAWSDRR